MKLKFFILLSFLFVMATLTVGTTFASEINQNSSEGLAIHPKEDSSLSVSYKYDSMELVLDNNSSFNRFNMEFLPFGGGYAISHVYYSDHFIMWDGTDYIDNLFMDYGRPADLPRSGIWVLDYQGEDQYIIRNRSDLSQVWTLSNSLAQRGNLVTLKTETTNHNAQIFKINR